MKAYLGIPESGISIDIDGQPRDVQHPTIGADEIIGILKSIITIDGDHLVSTAADGYQWFFNVVAIPNATGQTLAPHSSGIYRVLVVYGGYAVSSDDFNSS